MSNALISVIVPVYNVETYLERCLNSILNNTYKYLEVICINDGSKDNSLEILTKYQNRDKRVIIIDKENQGVSAARNDGLRTASGQWIAFIDSDDWIHPQYFEVLLAIAEKTAADVVAGNYFRRKEYETFAAIDIKSVNYDKMDLKTIYKSSNIKFFVWGKLYKREVLSGIWFDEKIKYGEDTLFNVLVYCNADKLRIISSDARIYCYYDRDGSVVNTVDTTDWIQQCREYINLAKKTNNKVIRMIYLDLAYKKLFITRYSEMYTKKRADVIRESNQLLKYNIKDMLKVNGIDRKEKIVYVIFTYIPQAYRFFRLINDPSMKTWEKSQRKICSHK